HTKPAPAPRRGRFWRAASRSCSACIVLRSKAGTFAISALAAARNPSMESSAKASAPPINRRFLPPSVLHTSALSSASNSSTPLFVSITSDLYFRDAGRVAGEQRLDVERFWRHNHEIH